MTIIADTISSDQTTRIIAAAEARAATIGVAANIAVLDAGAHLKGFVRMDGAVLGSIDIAQGKARTAALFGISSEAVWDYCQPGAAAHHLEASNGGLMPFAGGLPVTSPNGTLIGAIGVSGGAPSQDLDIAEAALAALVG
ncbi:GlcG/HbpS family heme-binding protein [Rhizobium rhizogenes]|uniref:GlcG/HbpS family heme-binding protein n=1 Tax=Rhizobium rhizogenes TaxID=359 RepID=UPI0015722D93|nr:heme-binding protein [Rhizobium rhizogenes]NTF83937.1 heme-binding protein [Rhizobium rhizogenes]